MSALQWALLIFGVVAVIAVYFASRRERKPEQPQAQAPESRAPKAAERQMDIFATGSGGFDEFGVSRTPRVVPNTGMPETPPEPAMEHPAEFSEAPGHVESPAVNIPPPPVPPRRAPTMRAAEPAVADTRVAAKTAEAAPARPGDRRIPPSFTRTEPPAPAEAAKRKVPDKIVSLLIAEREGTHILGDQIHAALRAQRLSYGLHQIYHRLSGDVPVFSVASLVKPGFLDPAQARSFSTPGLTIFMVLPGPREPMAAFRDMLATAEALSRELNAELYDGKRKPMNSAALRALQADVETWAREYAR